MATVSHTSRHAEGARDIVPMLLGVAPLALVIGATVHAAAVDKLAGWSGSFLLVAGTAQLTSIELIDRGVAPAVVIATVALINMRFALYSPTFARWFRTEPLRRRLWLVFPLVDQLYVLCVARFERGDLEADERRAYWVGAAATLALGWTVLQAAALLFAGALPTPSTLAAVAPISLAGLLGLSVKDRATAAAAAAGALAALLATGLPNQTGLLVAVAAGALLGSVADRRAP
jgi:predicted branched-subunit amino acid permease